MAGRLSGRAPVAMALLSLVLADAALLMDQYWLAGTFALCALASALHAVPGPERRLPVVVSRQAWAALLGAGVLVAAVGSYVAILAKEPHLLGLAIAIPGLAWGAVRRQDG